MRIGVGLDLVEVASVAESVAAHGQRYLRRIYTDAELHDCRDARGSIDVPRLAGRFAAKEAALKALAVGDDAVPWRSIGVRTESTGAPALHLTGAAAALARERGVSDLALSITHEGNMAGAVVVAQMGSSDER